MAYILVYSNVDIFLSRSVCKDMCTSYKSQFEEDKVILKRAKCSDQEWMEYEEKVESEMEMAELLDDLGGRV